VANDDMTTIAELSDADLDMVSAGSNHGALVNINLPINIGIQIANQTNTAVFSVATQGGSQWLNLGQFGIA
jgi:hypothetical protein